MGRVVMLAPPDRGSEIVDAFGDLAIFHKLTGPAGQDSPPAASPRRSAQISTSGVIAGNRSINPLFSAMIPVPTTVPSQSPSTKVEAWPTIW